MIDVSVRMTKKMSDPRRKLQKCLVQQIQPGWCENSQWTVLWIKYHSSEDEWEINYFQKQCGRCVLKDDD